MTPTNNNDDERFMRMALNEARLAADADEVPIGAVIVSHGQVIARAHNRTETLTDQLFIKAARIRSIQTKGCSMVDEGIVPEFIGLVNYSLVGLIQLDLGVAEVEDLTQEKALELYDAKAREAQELMLRKNHDYNEAWRAMRVSSYVDLIYMKIFRTKQIEDLDGTTRVSEGIAANYMDIMNYAVFGLIKLTLEQD